MKKLLLLLSAFFAISAAQAQYYYVPYSGSNPGNLNTDTEYPPGGGLTTGWTTLFTGTAATFTAPVWSNNVTLPFAFNFNGSPVTDYKVATSGVVTFTTSATTVPSDVNTALPSADIPDKSIVIWGLAANAGDYVVTKTFGTAPNRQHWISFNSYSHPGSTSIFTYWSIVLEETTNKIYIVDQRTANGALTLTAGIQVNSSTAFQVTGSPNLNSLSTGDPNPTDNNYYAFTQGTQPTYDMSVTSINLANYLVLASAPFNIIGNIKNYGTAPVTSFTLNYKINNGAVVSSPITANIASQGTYQFSHPTTWTPAASGNYTIVAWATNINGNADQATSNDEGSKTVYVAANTVQRTVLHEVFTSSTCPPCNPGNANLHTITTANPGKSIDIKYQQNYPAPGNDPYSFTQGRNRHTNFYGINSIPRMEVDGGWDGNANSYTTTLLNSFRSKPSIIGVSGTYTVVGHTVTAQAVIDPIGNNIASNNLVVYMAITEKQSVLNARTNGETVFYDVMKRMLPNELGNAIAPLVAGTTQTINQTYTFPKMGPPNAVGPDSVENFNNLDVVIFVQDKVTHEVFQAAKATKLSGPTGIAEDKAANFISIYPNPTNGIVTIKVPQEKAELVKMTVYNTLGQQVKSANSMTANEGVEIDLSAQARGIYFVNVQIGDNIYTKKVSLVK